MKTIEKKPMENPNSLLVSLLYSKPFESEATKHGKSMEAHALRKYSTVNKRKHSNFSVCNSGLVIMEDYPYIGTSLTQASSVHAVVVVYLRLNVHF